MWSAQKGTPPMHASQPLILGYLLHLKHLGLAVSSIKGNLAAISAFHPEKRGHSVFANPMVTRFLKGLDRLYPHVRHPISAWNLNLILSRLMGPPFEPLATCLLLYLSWKVTFLVAITSARRVSELQALTSDPHTQYFTRIQCNYNRTWLSFLKVVSHFHTNQEIFLPVFFPKPHANNKECSLHSLDIRRSLAFYIECIRPFRKSN